MSNLGYFNVSERAFLPTWHMELLSSRSPSHALTMMEHCNLSDLCACLRGRYVSVVISLSFYCEANVSSSLNGKMHDHRFVTVINTFVEVSKTEGNFQLCIPPGLLNFHEACTQKLTWRQRRKEYCLVCKHFRHKSAFG